MDMLVDDGFVETLPEGHRAAHAVLRNYGFYMGSSLEQRLQLLEAAESATIPQGTVLMEAGYSCGAVVFTGQGRLRVYITGESGREVTLFYVEPGESCPVNLGAAITGAVAQANASADQDLSAVTIPSSRFRQLCRTNAALGDYVLAATVMRFGDVIALIREITTKRVDQRLAEYLLREFDRSQDAAPVIKTTHRSVAEELGTAREVVTRRLQELERAGAVELQRGRIRLRDRGLLHRIIR